VTDAPALAYLGARLQARLGDRPPPAQWQRLGGVADFGHLVQTVRGTPLGRWVAGIAGDAAPAGIEAALRAGFRRDVAEVSGWAPEAWRPAIRWTDRLPDLPLVAHLLRGGPLPDAARADPRFADLAGLAPERRTAFLEAGPFRPVVAAWRADAPLAEAWLGALRARMPALAEAEARTLERLADTLRALRGRLVPPGRPGAPARPALTAAAEAALIRAFRERPQSGVAALAWLGLVWLDLQRLRGALIARRIREAGEADGAGP
jgi:hypothetical protein